MSFPLSNTAETGSDTAVVTTGNSASPDAWNFVSQGSGSGGSVTFSADHPADGLLGYKFVHPTASGFPPLLRWTTALGTTPSEYWGRLYTYQTGFSTVSQYLIYAFNTGARLFNINLNATGKLRISNTAGTTVYTSTNSVPLNELVRWEFHVIHSATVGRVETQFFHGHSMASIENGNFGVNMDSGTAVPDQINFNNASNLDTTGFTWYMDAIVLSAAGPIGPVNLSDTIEMREPATIFGPF